MKLMNATPLDIGITDSDAPTLTYEGTWTTGTFAYAYGGTARQTTQDGAKVTFETYSNGFTVYLLYQSGGDNMDVCINAVCTVIGTDGIPARASAEFIDLDAGLKEIEIVSRGDVIFDGVYIHPFQPLTETISTFEFGGETYTSNLDFSVSAADVVVILLLAVLATIAFARFVLEMWQR